MNSCQDNWRLTIHLFIIHFCFGFSSVGMNIRSPHLVVVNSLYLMELGYIRSYPNWTIKVLDS